MDFGDTQIDPTSPAFTVSEAAQVARVSEMDIRNWFRRGVVAVGEKNRLGRIAFSQIDVLKLRVIGDLNKLLAVEPSAAAPIADHVADHALLFLQRENRHLRITKEGKRRETRLIVHLSDDGKGSSITPYDWGEALLFTVPERGGGNQWARGAFVVLPIEQVMHDVLEETWAILEADHGEG